jgi:transposase
MASDTLHVDDTPVPVLAPGTGKTKTGRLWTYVRDERPFASSRPPAALFCYSPDRTGEHPQRHLRDSGASSVRRKFFDVHAATGSPIAKEALDGIGDLYKIDKTIAGLPRSPGRCSDRPGSFV